MKKKTEAKVLSQKMIATNIYDLWLETDIAKDAHAGQFIGVYTNDKSAILPRPISICEVSDDKKSLRLVYRVAGKGTGNISGLKEGDNVEVIGVLGNGYDLDKILKNKEVQCECQKEAAVAKTSVILMGGGIGIPPMLQLAKELCAQGINPTIIVGYRDSEMYLNQDLAKYGNVEIATEDGSIGTKGNVLNVVDNKNLTPDIIMACGPMPMLRAIKNFAAAKTEAGKATKAFISLEERMACGVGACLGCVCKTKEVNHHSHVNNARICTDGPVFDAEDVEI